MPFANTVHTWDLDTDLFSPIQKTLKSQGDKESDLITRRGSLSPIRCHLSPGTTRSASVWLTALTLPLSRPKAWRGEKGAGQMTAGDGKRVPGRRRWTEDVPGASPLGAQRWGRGLSIVGVG